MEVLKKTEKRPQLKPKLAKLEDKKNVFEPCEQALTKLLPAATTL